MSKEIEHIRLKLFRCVGVIPFSLFFFFLELKILEKINKNHK